MPDLNVLTIDLGGSHATCAIVRGGTVLTRRVLATDGSSLARLLPALSESLLDMLAESGIGARECAAVVLGFCGVVSAKEKRVLGTNRKFDDAVKIDLRRTFEQDFESPFLLENDARLALLGEYGFGAARGVEDAVMITLGSGIGGAAMLGGQLVESKHGLAGTIGGHVPVVLNGRLCTCGNRGCAESEASTVFLPEIYREQAGSREGILRDRTAIGFAELFAAIDAGDKPSLAAFDRCIEVWSALTVALIHVYDPEVVIFGGGVVQRAEQILPRIQEHVSHHAWTPGRTVPLRPAALGLDAALLGAIPLVEYSL